jgi:O-antigen/teichoic acid export membrane protein
MAFAAKAWAELSLRAAIDKVRGVAGSDSSVLVLTTAGTAVTRLASTIVLTRLLAPDAFGLISIIASVFVAIQLVTDLGFEAFVVRHEKGDDPRFLDIVWTVHFIRNIGIAALLVAAAGPLSQFLGKPEIRMPFAAASLTFVGGAVQSMTLISALRHGEVKKLCYLDLALVLAQVLVSIVLAALFRSVWALVGAMLFQSAAKAVCSYVLFPAARRRIVFGRDVTRELMAFSKFIIPSSLITLLISQMDRLVLAKLFTLEQLGMYAIAYSLSQVAGMLVSPYASRMLYPLYARTWREDPDALARIYYPSKRAISCLYAFGIGAMSGASSLIVALLYDPRYQGAALYLMILAAGLIPALASRSANEALMASGRLGATLSANIYRLVILAIFGVAGVALAGPVGMVFAVAAVEILVYPYFLVKLRQMGFLNAKEEALQILLGLGGLAVGWAVAALVLKLFPIGG